MKLIRTNLYVASTSSETFYLEADSLEEALEMARKHTPDLIREVRHVSSYLYRKSIKTITVEV